jgi:UDP-glucose 4-epimerase
MIVIIGGNGFIGRHLSCLAHRQGVPFTVVSRRPDQDFLDDHAPSGRSMSADAFAGRAGQDLLASADAVVYLVRHSDPASFTDNPWREIEIDTAPAFREFVRIARANTDLRLINASSGGTVYGHQTEGSPVDEMAPLAPVSPYGLGNVLREQALAFVGRTHGLRFDNLRISNPVGVWNRRTTQGLAMAAIRAIETGTPMPVYGSGDKVRDFLDADDLAGAILLAAQTVRDGSGTWNVGSGRGYSVNEVIRLVSDVTGRAVPVTRTCARGVDVSRITLDASRFSEAFGWRPTTTLRASIAKIASSLGFLP